MSEVDINARIDRAIETDFEQPKYRKRENEKAAARDIWSMEFRSW